VYVISKSCRKKLGIAAITPFSKFKYKVEKLAETKSGFSFVTSFIVGVLAGEFVKFRLIASGMKLPQLVEMVCV
jgi:hypothetical protein